MALVYGKVESLKHVKKHLEENRIHRFSSIADIQGFLKGYEEELSHIESEVKSHFHHEVEALQIQENDLEDQFITLKSDSEEALKVKLNKLRLKAESKKPCYLWRWLQRKKLKRLEENFDQIILKKLTPQRKKIKGLQSKRLHLIENERKIIDEQSRLKRQELERTKALVDEMHPLIAGAIGEAKVSKELQKLPDDYILINDFSKEFRPPIYNKRTGDRIYSVQIDHLLIARSGIFVLETKNWSQKSLNDLDLRSPVEQILRSSYALYVLFNGKERPEHLMGLKKHHWGDQKIPIRNVIVMLNHKPKESFRYVQVKTIKELPNYVQYFEPVFSKDEVLSLFNYAKHLRDS